MDTKHLKTMLVRTMYIMVILAVAVSVSTAAHAAPSSPFIGQWKATDVDGSDMSLSIAGRPNGPFQITWTDNYIAFCNGEAGILRGNGWLNEGDTELLEADMHLECFTTGAALDFHVTFRYHPVTNTLSVKWNFGPVTIWHRPGGGQVEEPPVLGLRVNYGHDWAESFYEAGHTAWITVTDGDGNVKATTELITEPKDYWGGETGFHTNDSAWFNGDGNPMENPPDIQPYDWVYGWLDNGASAQVQIGEINGKIDLGANSIAGTINAPWFTEPVQVECLDWGSGGETPFDNKDSGFIMANNSDPYSCSWEGEWDIQPGQTVGVGYSGPDGNWVSNALIAPNPRIVASDGGDWFWVTEFYPGQLDISIYESAEEGAALLWSGQQEAADLWGITSVGYDVHGQDLVPGNYVVVSDGVNEKGLVLETVTVDMFDVNYDFMSGTAPAGRDLWVAAGPQDWQVGMWVTADPATGEWFADFTTIPFDITEDMQPWSYAQLFDEDGDANEGDVTPLEQWLAVYTYDLPAGYWTDGLTYTYHYEWTWSMPGPGGVSIGADRTFYVSSEAPLYDGFVLLRGAGPLAGFHTDDGLVCEGVNAVNPGQATRFHNGWMTDYPMTYAEALAHFDSLSSRAILEDGQSLELVRHEVISATSVDWAQYVCSFTE